MKFLCVTCDEPMKLTRSAPPDRGALRVVYACPTCAHEIAMLTNPHETQLVQSLGVRIGPREDAPGELSGCPFSGMVAEMTSGEPATEFPWTEGAAQRLQNIPEFVRPMARSGIEQFAKDHGYPQVDETVMDEAREHFDM